MRPRTHLHDDSTLWIHLSKEEVLLVGGGIKVVVRNRVVCRQRLPGSRICICRLLGCGLLRRGLLRGCRLLAHWHGRMPLFGSATLLRCGRLLPYSVGA